MWPTSYIALKSYNQYEKSLFQICKSLLLFFSFFSEEKYMFVEGSKDQVFKFVHH